MRFGKIHSIDLLWKMGSHLLLSFHAAQTLPLSILDQNSDQLSVRIRFIVHRY